MSRRLLSIMAASVLLALLLSAPAGAFGRPLPGPGLPALHFPGLRDGNNTTGNGTDITPPTLAITSHRDRETVKEASVTVRGTVSDAGGIRALEVSVNGGKWAPAMGTELWYIPIKLEQGANTILVRASDLSGNVAEQNVSIVLSASDRDNLGIILAAALIFPLVAVLVLFMMRRKAPPADRPEDHDDLEKRLGLEGKDRDDSGSTLEDSEEVTRIDRSPPKKKSARRGP